MLNLAFANPYSHTQFFDFFLIFISRLFTVRFKALAPDEVQIFVLAFVAIACATVGSFLVLRKITMLANALSHTSLLGIILAYLLLLFFKRPDLTFNIPFLLIAATLAGFITAFLTGFLTKVIKLQEEASVGLVFSSLFAGGILLVTLFAKESHIGTELLCGNVDALKQEDLILAGFVALLNVLFITIFFKELKLTTFDPSLAATCGISPSLFHYLLTLLTAATTISAFRAVGVLMVLAFMTGPPLTARLLTNRLKPMLFIASLIGIVAAWLGVALSRHILTSLQVGLSTGGITVIILICFYLATLAAVSAKKWVKI